jgi:hypothetical protein
MSDYLPNLDTIQRTDDTILQKHWNTLIPFITNKISNYCIVNNYTNILEIGPGTMPLPIANYTIDVTKESRNTQFCIDIDKDKIPLSNQYIHFGYARHVFEDIQNPDFAFYEMKRVCKKFYIETPSPMIEILRGIDVSSVPPYRGYIHHRYLVWSKNNVIYFLPKYPIIEHLNLDVLFEKSLINIANKYPYSWNNYILCDENTTIVMYKNGINFDINISCSTAYVDLINRAIIESMESTNQFITILNTM